MKEKVENLKLEVTKKLESTTCLKEVNDIKVEYLGKKGPVQELTSHMKELSSEEKREFGMLLNELKQELTSTIDAKIKYYEEEALNQKLASEKIDVTLPSTTIPVGAPNILEKLIEEVEEVFMSMGYDVVDGPEIEEDKKSKKKHTYLIISYISSDGNEDVIKLETLIKDASNILAKLTNYASIAIGPHTANCKVEEIKLVKLGHDRLMIVILADNGI